MVVKKLYSRVASNGHNAAKKEINSVVKVLKLGVLWSTFGPQAKALLCKENYGI